MLVWSFFPFANDCTQAQTGTQEIGPGILECTAHSITKIHGPLVEVAGGVMEFFL